MTSFPVAAACMRGRINTVRKKSHHTCLPLQSYQPQARRAGKYNTRIKEPQLPNRCDPWYGTLRWIQAYAEFLLLFAVAPLTYWRPMALT